MNPFSESNLVEQTVIDIIKNLWNDPSCHINAYSDAEDAKLGRAHRGVVVLKKYLRHAIQKVNPEAPPDALGQALEQAIERILRDRSYIFRL